MQDIGAERESGIDRIGVSLCLCSLPSVWTTKTIPLKETLSSPYLEVPDLPLHAVAKNPRYISLPHTGHLSCIFAPFPEEENKASGSTWRVERVSVVPATMVKCCLKDQRHRRSLIWFTIWQLCVEILRWRTQYHREISSIFGGKLD